MDPDEELTDKLAEKIGKILDEFAKKMDMPVKDVCEQFLEEGERRQTEAQLQALQKESIENWGTLPQDYDPSKDESHPLNKSFE